jgi:predicted nucleic acid-binding Zn ribbon protein
MAILDKINDFAKNVGGMTGNVIETSKLNSKISAEQNEINSLLKKIGEFYYNKYVEKGNADKGITEFCEKIDGHNKAIAGAKAEIARVTKAAGGLVCSACGKPGAADKKFCGECGGKLVTAAAPAAAGSLVCPACGKPNANDRKFCAECGGKLKGD